MNKTNSKFIPRHQKNGEEPFTNIGEKVSVNQLPMEPYKQTYEDENGRYLGQHIGVIGNPRTDKYYYEVFEAIDPITKEHIKIESHASRKVTRVEPKNTLGGTRKKRRNRKGKSRRRR